MPQCVKCGKHGLFLKLTNGYCDDCYSIRLQEIKQAKEAAKEQYDQLSEMIKNYGTGNSYEEITEKCEAILDYIAEIDQKRVWKLIIENSDKNGNISTHPLFGCIFESDVPFAAITKKIQNSVCIAKDRAASVKKYDAAYAQLHPVDLILDQDGKLIRNALSTMPEVKYTPVGNKFNKDKLMSFVIIDTETTGLSAVHDRIIELSAIRYEDFEPAASFSTLVNPGIPIPTDATEVNGLTDEDVADAPALDQVAKAFWEFVGSSPVVGYNLPFDFKFLYSAGINLDDGKRKFFDALDIARRAYGKKAYSYKLDDIAADIGIFRSNAHRSLSDCLTTGYVFEDAINTITNL